MSSDPLAPEMVAIWDQRAAIARALVDHVSGDEWVRDKTDQYGLVDAGGFAALSFAINKLIPDRREVNDALAIALIRLAARND